jgi:hypothetical protein
VEAKRHVVDRRLVVAARNPALPGLKPGQEFVTEFSDHMIFQPGPKGTVIIRNAFGDPVYVIGEIGKGRVVYSGCYYGYAHHLKGLERQVLLDLVEWLCGASDAGR